MSWFHTDDDSDCTATGADDVEMSPEWVWFCKAHHQPVEETQPTKAEQP